MGQLIATFVARPPSKYLWKNFRNCIKNSLILALASKNLEKHSQFNNKPQNCKCNVPQMFCIIQDVYGILP